MEAIDDTARAQQLAEYLTLATGEAWQQRPDHNGHPNVIYGPQLGEHLYIGSVSGQPQRIAIHGSLTIGTTSLYNYLRSISYSPHHSITVRADRAPAAIAGAIARRLLPNYRRDLAAGLAAYHAAEEQHRQVQQIAAELAASLRGGVYNHTGNGDSFYDGLTGISVKGYVSSPSSISFDIHGADLPTAYAIMQAILANQPTSQPSE
jgi:hypothetical protein